MVFKNKLVKAAFAVGFAAISFAAELQAAPSIISDEAMAKDSDRQVVKPAQAIVQDTSTITPTLGQPIAFAVTNLQKNVKIKNGNTVFKVEVPGLYRLAGFLTVNAPDVGESFTAGFLINGQSYLNFIDVDVSTGETVPLLITERFVYLNKGDEVSVSLLSAPNGTTVGERGFTMVAFNNTKN